MSYSAAVVPAYVIVYEFHTICRKGLNVHDASYGLPLEPRFLSS